MGFVKGNFFTGRRFRHLQDLKEQLEAWLMVVNNERPSDATGEVPAVRARAEALKPCPHKAESYPFKTTAVVRPTARVCHKGLEYSVPAERIGQEVTLHLEEHSVGIYVGNRFLTRHPRCPENGQSSVLAEHAEELFVFPRGKPRSVESVNACTQFEGPDPAPPAAQQFSQPMHITDFLTHATL
ncbi:MAG: hypothetical protein KME03_11095, partial [Aphanocapsa lilacina HA4352-LM1]|nr:hypothetical protein [Aphanocapsa lilacina HA4352-LM1]